MTKNAFQSENNWLFKMWKELVSHEFTFGDMIICSFNCFVQNAGPFPTLQEVLV